MANNPMLEAALDYILEGFRVFPVGSDKKPLTKHGLKDATQTQLGVKEYWGKYPNAGIGLLTDGLIVLDFDAGKGGHESKVAIEAQYGSLPRTRTHRTGGGGLHYIYRNPNERDIRNTVSLGGYQGVDLRGSGGYIVAPPSLHESGRKYEVLDDCEIAPAPSWLLELATKKTQTEAIPEGQPIIEGQRNATLASLAGTMRRRGMPQSAIEAALLEVNATQCQPPLSDNEISQIAESIVRYPSSEPKANIRQVDTRLTDTGNAELLASLFDNQMRFDHRRHRWLLWRRHHWQPDRDGQISRLAVEAARVRYTRAENIEDLKERQRAATWAISSENRMRLEACAAVARSIKPIADSGDNWDTGIWLLGVNNGVVDLKTGELRPGQPSDRITMTSGGDFEPDARCPRWLQFLDEVFGDNELIDWLHRALGYSLTGDTTEQAIFIGHGIGANGKGVFCGALHAALGDYTFTSPFSTFELYQRASIPNDLAALEFRRFVTSSETNDNTRLNEARIKAISGCDPITARYLHQEYFTFWPHLKLWLFVNHKPKVADDSFGFWRRVRLIPFTRRFTGEADDRRLSAKLRAEVPGILSWLVRGCLEWQKQGLDPVPECVKVATQEYRKESDILAGFIADKCIEHPNATIRASELYSAYRQWAEGEGMRDREILTSTSFGRRMRERYQKAHGRAGTFYQGIGLSCDGLVTGSRLASPETMLPREGDSLREETRVTSHNPSRQAKLGENPSQALPDDLSPSYHNPSQTPDCPKCGCNEWAYSPNGDLLCPCGNSVKGGSRQ